MGNKKLEALIEKKRKEQDRKKPLATKPESPRFAPPLPPEPPMAEEPVTRQPQKQRTKPEGSTAHLISSAESLRSRPKRRQKPEATIDRELRELEESIPASAAPEADDLDEELDLSDSDFSDPEEEAAYPDEEDEGNLLDDVEEMKKEIQQLKKQLGNKGRASQKDLEKKVDDLAANVRTLNARPALTQDYVDNKVNSLKTAVVLELKGDKKRGKLGIEDKLDLLDKYMDSVFDVIENAIGPGEEGKDGKIVFSLTALEERIDNIVAPLRETLEGLQEKIDKLSKLKEETESAVKAVKDGLAEARTELEALDKASDACMDALEPAIGPLVESEVENEDGEKEAAWRFAQKGRLAEPLEEVARTALVDCLRTGYEKEVAEMKKDGHDDKTISAHILKLIRSDVQEMIDREFYNEESLHKMLTAFAQENPADPESVVRLAVGAGQGYRPEQINSSDEKWKAHVKQHVESAAELVINRAKLLVKGGV